MPVSIIKAKRCQSSVDHERSFSRQRHGQGPGVMFIRRKGPNRIPDDIRLPTKKAGVRQTAALRPVNLTDVTEAALAVPVAANYAFAAAFALAFGATGAFALAISPSSPASATYSAARELTFSANALVSATRCSYTS